VQAGNHRRSGIGLFPEKAQCVELVLRIEVVGRLVEQVDVRLLREDLCNGQPSTFAAGQGQHVAARKAVQIDSRQRRVADLDILDRFPLKAPDMRVPSNHRRIEYGCRKDIVNVLWQQREMPRCILSPGLGDILPAQLDRPPGRRA
jgi:hypothetical protein